MSPTRPANLRTCAIAAGVWVLAACGRDTPAPAGDSAGATAAPVTVSTDSAVPPADDSWSVLDGSALYLPGDAGAAQVVLPPVHDDSVPQPRTVTLPAHVAPASIDLFAPAGKVGSAAVGEFVATAQPDSIEGCDAWPVLPLRDVQSGVGAWRIALRAGTADPMRADSIGALPPADSARLVVDINKAAALLPIDSAGLLRRVPFTVTSAYRTTLPDGVELVVTVVERRLNMEASPKTERTVLLLERAPGAKAFSASWRDTQFATEDELIAVDLMAVVTMHAAGRPAVFLSQDFGDGTRVQMLQRTATGSWVLRWSSAYTGC